MAVAALVAVFLATVAAAAAVRLLLAYLKFRRLELAIPGPYSLPLLGNTLDFVGVTEDTVLSTLMALWGGRHTDLSRFSLVGHSYVFVSDPDHLQQLFRRRDLLDKDKFLYSFMEPIQDGLVTLNGAKWRAHRRLLQPAFHQSMLERHTAPIFSSESLGFVRRVRAGGEAQSVEANLHTLMTRAFVTSILHASDLGDDGERLERALPDIEALVSSVSHAFSYRSFQPWLWPSWVFGMTAAGREIRRLKASVDAFCRDGIAGRRAHREEKSALMDVLVDPGVSLTDEEISCEVQEITGAAVDTTTGTLGWVLKTLSLKPDVQQRLLQEVEEVLGKDAATRTAHITNDDLNRLEYTERVIKETLRLLPATPITGRGVKEETDFCGHTLPAGTTLIVNARGAHRHPDHWPDPLRFDPDRFLPENSVGRHPYAYIPFSAGPRACLGSRYAMMLMKTLLATLVPRYRIDPVDDGYKEPADLPTTFGLTSRMVGGVRVVFTPRAGCAA